MSNFSSKALEEIKIMREAGFSEKQIHAAIDSYLEQIDKENAAKKAEAERKNKEIAERQALEKEFAELLAKIYDFYGIRKAANDVEITNAVRSMFHEFEFLKKIAL